MRKPTTTKRTEKEIVAKMVALRAQYVGNRPHLIDAVNDWFVTDRFTRAEKHMAFDGVYAHDGFIPDFNVGEKIDLFYLCEKNHYLHMQPEKSVLAALHTPKPAPKPVEPPKPHRGSVLVSFG